jgi:hypothetical protein
MTCQRTDRAGFAVGDLAAATALCVERAERSG